MLSLSKCLILFTLYVNVVDSDGSLDCMLNIADTIAIASSFHTGTEIQNQKCDKLDGYRSKLLFSE